MIKPRPQKLLIIDEINYMRLMLSQTLSNDGYKVVTAQNSGEAMQHIATELPNVILLSLRSSDTGAVSALKALKDYFRLRLDVAQGAEPAIIVLSDLKDARQIREVQTLGISQNLSKPVNIQELRDAIKTAITSTNSALPEKRMKIMLFDSDMRSQQFLESVLAHEIYDIEGAESEAELLARIKHRDYDLSIMDLTSFEREIPEVLRNIKEITERMPVITVATSADQISQDELEKLGVQVHFVKPLNIDVFRTEVDALLQAGSESQEEPVEQTEESSDEQTEESSDEQTEESSDEQTEESSDEQTEESSDEQEVTA